MARPLKPQANQPANWPIVKGWCEISGLSPVDILLRTVCNGATLGVDAWAVAHRNERKSLGAVPSPLLAHASAPRRITLATPSCRESITPRKDLPRNTSDRRAVCPLPAESAAGAKRRERGVA